MTTNVIFKHYMRKDSDAAMLFYNNLKLKDKAYMYFLYDALQIIVTNFDLNDLKSSEVKLMKTNTLCDNCLKEKY